MRESKIREALKARVETYGGEIRAVSWLGRNHAPDVLCLLPSVLYNQGTHCFVETKQPKKTATKAQAREHDRLRDAGCAVLVITTLEELDKWLPAL